MTDVNPQALAEVLDAAKEQAVKMARDILDESQRLVPVDTGNLRRSGKVVETDDGADVVYTADYAAYVEAERPFLTPAALKVRG